MLSLFCCFVLFEKNLPSLLFQADSLFLLFASALFCYIFFHPLKSMCSQGFQIVSRDLFPEWSLITKVSIFFVFALPLHRGIRSILVWNEQSRYSNASQWVSCCVWSLKSSVVWHDWNNYCYDVALCCTFDVVHIHTLWLHIMFNGFNNFFDISCMASYSRVCSL